MAKFEQEHIIEAVRKTPEYAEAMKLPGIEDVTTHKNARRGSMFFRTPAPSPKINGKINGYYEYSVYHAGYLRIYSGNGSRYGRYGMLNSFQCERPDIEYEVYRNHFNVNYDNENKGRYGYAIKKKHKRAFFKMAYGYITGFNKIYDIYYKKIYNSHLVVEIKFINEIPENQLALHISHKWKTKYTAKIFFNRLKTGNKTLKTKIM